ncbi:MAG TPA: hypothetical protein VEQ85_06580 [Lacipirellulaceae bacterium]|nr:hypothetical protein [Lacipirellulaceae bacterium]
MKSIVSRHACLAFILAAFAPAAHAQFPTFDAVAVYDEQATNEGNNLGNAVDTEALGNNVSLAAFKAEVALAFAQNRGGVVDFEGLGTIATPTPTFVARFGANLDRELSVTRTDVFPFPGGGWDVRDNNGVISGHHYLGIASSTPPFTMSFSRPLEAVALTGLSRGSVRQGDMSFTYDDQSATAFPTEVIAEADDDTVFIHRAPSGKSIVSLSWTNANFVRWDDLGFIVSIPEPNSLALAIAAALGLCRQAGRNRVAQQLQRQGRRR